MNRLDKLFEQKNSRILNIYFTAGYPYLDNIAPIGKALEESGTDILEIGMPYSDPLADGETIQNSSRVALENGMNLTLLFEGIEKLRTKSEIPIILMGYYNQVLQYGEVSFLEKCQAVGVDGLILPDLPMHVFEEHYASLFEKFGLRSTFLVTPQTSDERIEKAAALSTGFLYVVSRSSITGSKSDIEDDQVKYFERIHRLSNNTPKLIGFGIHNKHSFDTACLYANGAIIGSEFIRDLKRNKGDVNAVKSFAHGIKGNM